MNDNFECTQFYIPYRFTPDVNFVHGAHTEFLPYGTISKLHEKPERSSEDSIEHDSDEVMNLLKNREQFVQLPPRPLNSLIASSSPPNQQTNCITVDPSTVSVHEFSQCTDHKNQIQSDIEDYQMEEAEEFKHYSDLSNSQLKNKVSELSKKYKRIVSQIQSENIIGSEQSKRSAKKVTQSVKSSQANILSGLKRKTPNSEMAQQDARMTQSVKNVDS